MKKYFKILGLVSLLFLVSCDPDDILSPDNVDYILGNPELAGKGCSDSSIHLTDDGKGVTMEMEDLTIKAGSSYRSLGRINCTVAVPISLPEGVQAIVLPAKISGKRLLQQGSQLKIKSETFLAGQEGIKAELNLEGKSRGDFTLESKELKTASISACGEDATLRLNLSMILKSKNKEQASAGKLTGLAEGESSLFKLKFIKCK